jgi:carbon storage regulator CsrA
MLVLTRKPGEDIRIERNITVAVLLVGRNRVKLGISGPSEIRVLRGELSPFVRSHEETSLRASACPNNRQ